MLRLGITEMYRVAKQLYDPYLPSYAYGNYWPVKIGKPNVRSFPEKNYTTAR